MKSFVQLSILIAKYGKDAHVSVVQGAEQELKKLFPHRYGRQA